MAHRHGRRRGIWAVVLLVLGVALLAGPIAVTLTWFTASRAAGENMLPTLAPGDLVVVRTDPPEVRRGDLVLYDPAEWGLADRLFFGRVVAVEGDRISYEKGDTTLTLNGQPLDEPYVRGGAPGAGGVDFDVTVEPGRVFILGDNRGNSADSRFHPGSHHGTLPVSAVTGVESDQESVLAVTLGLAMTAGLLLLPVGGGLGIASLVARRRHKPVPAGPVWGSVHVE